MLRDGEIVIGIDNLNDYYDPLLKHARLNRLTAYPNYQHHAVNLEDSDSLAKVFVNGRPDKVINLAAQPGIGYSLKNPYSYVTSNIVGFVNVLEACRDHKIEHLVYASSSSVYGANTKMPFSTQDCVDHPLNLYAASKKSNELMAHAYSHLFGIPTTGLRFFTVYGPWGRPDMALFKFAKAILSGDSIELFNNGKHMRDFTYIDDIVEGLIRILSKPPIKSIEWNGENANPATSKAPWAIYNIGNGNPVSVNDFILVVEKYLRKTANKNFLPIQDGHAPDTHADTRDLERDFGYRPKTNIDEGIAKFIEWYLDYYKV